MPIYEFLCRECGARFEALVAASTEAEECRECGAPGATRVMSTPAQVPKLVRSAVGNRRQEAKNRTLHQAAKSDFKAKRERARAKGAKK
ncbi:MAG TPA: zinc ribbon domain-containing protein [Solirubrobacterales bacterium]